MGRDARMTQDLPESEVFILLSKRRRRLLITSLQESSTPPTATELAERIADREYENPSPGDVESVVLTLYHNHLPRLEEADVVEYNEDAGTVRPGLHFGPVVRMLETVDEADLPWSDR